MSKLFKIKNKIIIIYFDSFSKFYFLNIFDYFNSDLVRQPNKINNWNLVVSEAIRNKINNINISLKYLDHQDIIIIKNMVNIYF